MSPDSGCRELTVAHGSVSHTHTGFGATARVVCDDCFYRSDGNDVVVCNEDGQWSAYPKCHSKYVKRQHQLSITISGSLHRNYMSQTSSAKEWAPNPTGSSRQHL